MSHPTRRNVLTSMAAGSLLGMPAIVRAQDKESVTLMTPFGFISDFIDMMNAISGGHLAKQGLDAKLIGGQGTAQAGQQLVAGSVQLVRASGIDQMRVVAQAGVPLVAVSTLYQSSNFYIVSPKEKPITSADQLKGKTVGLVSVGGTTEVFVTLILNKVGLTKDDVKFETTGNSPAAFDMARQGRVDCFIASINVVMTLEKMNAAMEVWNTDRYVHVPGQCYVTSRQLIEQRPQTIQKIVNGLKASVMEMMSSPLGPIFDRAIKDFDIPGIKDKETLVRIENTSRERFWLAEGPENLMRNVPRIWKEGVDAMRAAGIAKLDDPELLYTNAFMDKS